VAALQARPLGVVATSCGGALEVAGGVAAGIAVEVIAAVASVEEIHATPRFSCRG
jgi:hypothetical protein